jgi:hypothetical protein
MLMGVPSAREARAFKKVLDDFMEASDTSINHLKSHIFFFNTPLSVQFHVSHILGFSRSSLPSKYLGVPLLTSGVRNSSWEDLLSKLSKKLSSWTFLPLNIASHLAPSQICSPSDSSLSFLGLSSSKRILKAVPCSTT